MPMPEAQASGRLEKRPMRIVMMPAPRQVAVTAAVSDIPASTSRGGFTAMM